MRCRVNAVRLCSSPEGPLLRAPYETTPHSLGFSHERQ